jgi:hypothetical protein
MLALARNLGRPLCRPSTTVYSFSILGLALLGVLAIDLLSPWRIGISPDSSVYLEGATNLVARGALVTVDAEGRPVPITHFPPLYPLVLAAIGMTGVDVVVAAKWLSSTLFAVSIILIGAILRSVLRDNPWIAFLGALVFATSFQMLSVYSMAWSEPLFIPAATLALWFVAVFLKEERLRYLLASALLVGVAWLARYVGVAVLIASAGSVLVLSRRSVRQRLVDSAVLVAGGCLPMAVWMVRNIAAAGSPTDRVLSVEPIRASVVFRGLSTMSEWFLPHVIGAQLRVGILLCVLLGLVLSRLWRSNRQGTAGGPQPALSAGGSVTIELSRVLVAFSSVYLIFLIVSISLFDAATPLDSRVLSPVFVAVLICVCCALGRITSARRGYKVLGAGLVALSVLQGIGWLFSHRSGQGYSSLSWRDSPTVGVVRTLPEGARIASNAVDALSILAGRRGDWVPRSRTTSVDRPNPQFEEQLAQLRAKLAVGDGYVVWFDHVHRWFLPTKSELQAALPLTAIATTEDGTIFVVRPD